MHHGHCLLNNFEEWLFHLLADETKSDEESLLEIKEKMLNCEKSGNENDFGKLKFKEIWLNFNINERYLTFQGESTYFMLASANNKFKCLQLGFNYIIVF